MASVLLIVVLGGMVSSGLGAVTGRVISLYSGVERGFESHIDVTYCSSFYMTKTQVLEYFSRAREISEREANTVYDWSPCFVAGTMDWAGEVVQWRINAFYVGVVERSDGKHYYACADCDDLYTEKEEKKTEKGHPVRRDKSARDWR